MEPFTQALLGAATAELVAGRELRGRALGWGAAIGMSPDLDVLLGGLHDGYGEWLYHRGTTHSLWFGFVVGPVIGWLLWRWRDLGHTSTLPGWIKLSIAALVTHPLLDAFTPYGTQLFAPFVRERFAWNGVAIVDPFYSVLLGTGVLLAALRRWPPGWTEKRRRQALIAGLLVSTGYLLAGLVVNHWVVSDLRRALAGEALAVGGGPIARVRAYPTIFQPWLRSFVVRTPDAVLVGLHSWQEASCPAWQVHLDPRSSPALRAVTSSWPGELLDWFADGDTARFVEREAAGVTRVRIEDVRYAWASPDARGLWGIEARVDASGRILGGIERLARIDPGAQDYGRIGEGRIGEGRIGAGRIGALLLGRLPAAGAGWHRPSSCAPASR